MYDDAEKTRPPGEDGFSNPHDALENSTDRLEQLARSLEKSGLSEYAAYLSKPSNVLLTNFLAGLARGFGFSVGMVLLGAFALYMLQHLVRMNLPYISELVAEIFSLASEYLQYGK